MKIRINKKHPYISSHVTIPVEIVKLEDDSYHLLIKAEIDGIQGELIIDTGASVSVIDKTICSTQWDGRDCEFQLQSGSVSGQIEHVELFKADCLKIGGRKLKNISFAAIDLKYVNEMYEKHLKRRVIGLLGCDFFVRYQAIIDYSASKLTLNLKSNSRNKQ